MKPILALLVALAPLVAQEPADLLEKKTLARIAELDARLDGVLGVTAIDLKTGHTFSYHGDLVTTQASLIKIPVLVTLFRAIDAGTVKLDQRVAFTAKDRVGGSGTLDARLSEKPLELSVDELTVLMVRDSDNTATNALIKLAGKERINALMTALKLPHTQLRRIMMDSAAAKRDDENTSTPVEMARLVEMIYRGTAASKASCQKMIGLLKLVNADFRGALPAGVVSWSKPGGVPGVHTEAGVVELEGRPYVLSVMSSMLAGGANPLRDVVEIVNEHFKRLAVSNRYGHRVADPLY